MTSILDHAPVIPVVGLHDAAHAVPLARALLAGGIGIMEITLRRGWGAVFAGRRDGLRGACAAGARHQRDEVLPGGSCVSGSWLTPPDVVRARDWRRVTELVYHAAALARH